jgi:hypothetical protein
MIVLFEIHLSGILKPNQIIKCGSKLTGWNLFDKQLKKNSLEKNKTTKRKHRLSKIVFPAFKYLP